MNTKSKEVSPNFIPNEAIKHSDEARHSNDAKPTKRTRDAFNEDKMSRDVPSDESVHTAQPDDTVRPG